MYNVVKNDPGYAKSYYKGNLNAIKGMLTQNVDEMRNYNDSDADSSGVEEE